MAPKNRIASETPSSAAMMKDNGGDFIFTAKESSHTALYDVIKGAEAFRHDEKVRGKTAFAGCLPRDGKDAMLVDWIGFEIVDAKGRVKYSMAWVTSFPVTKQNVAMLVARGRTRWKIENEGCNMMKNNGYAFEHNPRFRGDKLRPRHAIPGDDAGEPEPPRLRPLRAMPESR
jgi:hypothetical protein